MPGAEAASGSSHARDEYADDYEQREEAFFIFLACFLA